MGIYHGVFSESWESASSLVWYIRVSKRARLLLQDMVVERVCCWHTTMHVGLRL